MYLSLLRCKYNINLKVKKNEPTNNYISWF